MINYGSSKSMLDMIWYNVVLELEVKELQKFWQFMCSAVKEFKDIHI